MNIQDAIKQLTTLAEAGQTNVILAMWEQSAFERTKNLDSDEWEEICNRIDHKHEWSRTHEDLDCAIDYYLEDIETDNDYEEFSVNNVSEIQGFFTSYWEEGKVETEGTIDLDTMEITCDSIECEYETLIREEFVTKGGEVYEVCDNCHEYALVDGKCPMCD